MEEGVFVAWHKADGDPVRPGDVLFALESDKATEDVEALDAGILRIPPDGPQPGQKVKVGQVLAYLAAEGEAVPSAGVRHPTASPGAGPAARRLARSLGVDILQVQGSGTSGRITEADVRRLGQAAPVADPPAVTTRRKPAVSPRARRVAGELGVDWR